MTVLNAAVDAPTDAPVLVLGPSLGGLAAVFERVT